MAGEKLDAFMKRMVFDPLGMTSSSFVWQDEYEGLKIFTHSSTGAPTGQNKVTQANAAASLQTTARDYGRFVAAILKGTGLKRETARLMLTPQVRVGESTEQYRSPRRAPFALHLVGAGLGITEHGRRAFLLALGRQWQQQSVCRGL